MCLEYVCKVSARMHMYNFSYGDFSTSYSVSYSLFCDTDFREIEDDFDKILNMKVVED